MKKYASSWEIGGAFDPEIDKAMAILERRGAETPVRQDNRTYEETVNGVSKVQVRLINITESAVQLRGYVWGQRSFQRL